jgi:hypothetical protein
MSKAMIGKPTPLSTVKLQVPFLQNSLKRCCQDTGEFEIFQQGNYRKDQGFRLIEKETKRWWLIS